MPSARSNSKVFVPLVDESKAHKIHHVPDIGMQAGVAQGSVKPKAMVIMGGLSMPNVPIKAEQVKAVIDRHAPGCKKKFDTDPAKYA